MTEITESWLDQLLRPDMVPPEALAGGLTPEMAWETWAAGEKPRSSAEAWWHGRFSRAYQQEHGVELGRAESVADRQAAVRRQAELEAGS